MHTIAINVNFANIATGLVNDAILQTLGHQGSVSAQLDTSGNVVDLVNPYVINFFRMPACGNQQLEASMFEQLSVQPESAAVCVGTLCTEVCTINTDGQVTYAAQPNAALPVVGGDHSVATCLVSGALRGCNTIRTKFTLSFTLNFGDC